MAMITLDGVEIASPSALKVEIEDVGTQSRAASGRLVTDRVAQKRRLSLSWSALSAAAASSLLTAVGATRFQVSYPDPATGAARTASFSCESLATKAVRADSGNARTDVEMTWIEA